MKQRNKIIFMSLLVMLLFTTIISAGERTMIYVDGNQVTDATQNKFQTITEALAAAPMVRSEEQRVIIEIADGIYREQIRVNKPYITLRSASNDASKVIITWYYGIGYVYNNIGPDGFYDSSVDWSADSTWAGLTRRKIGDKVSSVTYYDKNGVLQSNRPVRGGVLGKPDRWGTTVKLDSGATNFIAENITFENSFNFYITQAELDAGVTPEPQAVPKPDRAVLPVGSTEVEKQHFIERAAALHTDSDRAIIRNSVIRSKQDTLYAGSRRILFDNCTIMGGTDYIFGGATAVFNECNLIFAGNADNNNTGTITAGSHSPSVKYGYLFWNSTVDYRLDKTPRAGNFGRPWSNPLGAQVTFVGTTIKKVNNTLLISDAAWGAMGSTQGDEARFYEYGSVDEQGNPINTSRRVINQLAPMGSVLDEWQVLEFNPYNYLRGIDGWDPLGYASYYVEIDNLLSTTTIDTDVKGNVIDLPKAPQGYGFFWASDSEYAVVSEDQSSIEVIRPAFGEPAVRATITLYAKDLATGYGDNKAVATEDTFSVSGELFLKGEPTTRLAVRLVFALDDVVIKSQTVNLAADQKSVEYQAEHLPAGTYDVTISTLTDGYKVTSAENVVLTGNSTDNVELNIEVAKLINIVLTTEDFSEDWATPTVTSPLNGFVVEKYQSTGFETANLGTGNTLYRFTKPANLSVPQSTGAYWDLYAAVKAAGGTLENTDNLRFSFDFLLETIDYLPSDYSYFDLATSLTNQGRNTADNTRFVRWGVHNGWRQFNMFGADNARVNGDRTQFDVNDVMANKWYRIVAEIDLKNQVVTSTLYNRDANTILNQKAFRISAPDIEGNNTAYPSAADLTKGLYFSVFMDNRNTTRQIEYYFDNLKLEYQDYSNE